VHAPRVRHAIRPRKIANCLLASCARFVTWGDYLAGLLSHGAPRSNSFVFYRVCTNIQVTLQASTGGTAVMDKKIFAHCQRQ
jgi:hypothetical protein